FLNWMQKRFPKSKQSIIALEKWFQQYGNMAVLLTRVVPLTRTYVSFLAGSQKLNVASFLSYSCLGITIWNTLLIMLGYFLGDNITLIDQIMKKYTLAIGIAFIVGIYLLWQKKKKPKVD
ncbi:MAG: DedA family protein, partial [Cellulosilyticaceae bacterium]